MRVPFLEFIAKFFAIFKIRVLFQDLYGYVILFSKLFVDLEK